MNRAPELPCPAGRVPSRLGTLLASWIIGFALLGLGPSSFSADSPATGTASQSLDFNRVIRPILSENCYKCHGPDDGARKSNLRFDLRGEASRPAKSGKIAIVPGAPERSEMISRVSASDAEKRMPPASTGKRLTAAQIAQLRTWINQG